ncbi:hypothetical protein DXB63_08345 [Bacteroides sp. OM05-12]|nr:hypothetical protein DXB63_08345 [Bacteroides sp. OM05-12]
MNTFFHFNICFLIIISFTILVINSVMVILGCKDITFLLNRKSLGLVFYLINDFYENILIIKDLR